MKTFEKLSRAEMKNVLGGDCGATELGIEGAACTSECKTSDDCMAGWTCQLTESIACPYRYDCV